MVTGNGDFPSQHIGDEYDLPSRRRVARPSRPDFLRVHPPSMRSPITHSPRSAHFRPPLVARGRYPPPTDPPTDPSSHASSPQACPGDGFNRSRPANSSPASPTSPTFPFDPLKPYPSDSHFDRPVRKPPPPRTLKASASASRLHNKHPKGSYLHERRPLDPSLSLPLPHFPPNGPLENNYGDDAPRSSDVSAPTSCSSFEHASGTERSSVLTKGSSITDFSPATPPDGLYGRDEGMSVEDAISMYLDGFSDVTEEPASPELYAEGKSRTISPLPSTESLGDDGHASGDHSLDPDPSQALSRVSPTPDTPPQNQDYPQQSSDISLQKTKAVLPGVVPPPLLSGTDSRDRYGFRKSTTHTSAEQYDTWNVPYSNFVASRKSKWIELLKENGLPTAEPTAFPPKSSKVKRFVRKGIPPEYRGAAWFWYAGGFYLLNTNPGHYGHLVQQAMASPTNDDKEHIERDLHRTFPDNIHFKPELAGQQGNPGASSGSSHLKHGSITYETEMIQSLRRVLYAFSLHNPKIGYTQSLNFITGLLLLFLPEEKAFWMLHVITSVFLPGTHEVSLEGANIDLWILMVLLRDSMPAVYGKIAGRDPATGRGKSPALSVHSTLPDITLGMTNWLMSVFIGTLPLETVLRAWDVFFYEGSKTFFRVSLAIFKACERDILAVSDPMEVFQVVQTVPKRLLDANTLIDACFIRRNRVGQGRIDELRESRRAAVRQEKARRSAAMSKGQLGSATDEWPRSRTPIPGIERRFADSWRQMRQQMRVGDVLSPKS